MKARAAAGGTGQSVIFEAVGASGKEAMIMYVSPHPNSNVGLAYKGQRMRFRESSSDGQEIERDLTQAGLSDSTCRLPFR